MAVGSLHFSVYILNFWTEVTLLVLLLQYLTEHTVCGCCWEQPEAMVHGCVDIQSCKMSSSVMLFQQSENCNFTSDFTVHLSTLSYFIV